MNYEEAVSYVREQRRSPLRGQLGRVAHDRLVLLSRPLDRLLRLHGDLKDAQTGYAFILSLEGDDDLVLATEQRPQMLRNGLAVTPPLASPLEHWEPRPVCHLYLSFWYEDWYMRLATN